MTDKDVNNYMEVDLGELKAGTLVDRSLYVHLPLNERFMRIAQPLMVLEERTLKIIQQKGKVFTNEPRIDERFIELATTAEQIQAICSNEKLAPFERNQLIRGITTWLVTETLRPATDGVAALFTFHRAFEVPRPKTLYFVSEISIAMYERSLRLAAVAGILCLWLGYSDTVFLSEFVQAVFCTELGSVTQDGQLRDLDEARKVSRELLDAGQVPGFESPDYRLRCLASDQSYSDELWEAIEFARWLLGMRNHFSREQAPACRVAKKLAQNLNFDFHKMCSKDAQLSTGEAAA